MLLLGLKVTTDYDNSTHSDEPDYHPVDLALEMAVNDVARTVVKVCL